ncbi:hypothetical protein SFRURICE_021531, partial [Spodoptera frugiperda]
SGVKIKSRSQNYLFQIDREGTFNVKANITILIKQYVCLSVGPLVKLFARSKFPKATVTVAHRKMRSLLAYYADAVMSAAARGAGCALECSGRGDCMNGTCLCEIRYSGDECAGPNMPYHACIGGVFLLVAFVCAVQLTICVVTEYRRLKAPTFLRACKVTTQKMLYLVAFLASLIRGAYFVS